jgi:hypothetical protein
MVQEMFEVMKARVDYFLDECDGNKANHQAKSAKVLTTKPETPNAGAAAG